jgi:hypothetical protein
MKKSTRSATISYTLSVGMLGLVGAFEAGRICSAIPDWATALLIPSVPFFGAIALERTIRGAPSEPKGGEK